MFKQKQKAFTLIELLVVIAIIGILATLAVVALQQARQNARDAKRMADMKQVQTALELFFNENGRYPTTDEWNSGAIVSSNTGETFMHSIPSAPTPADGGCLEASNTYVYTTQNSGASYTIDFCTGKQVSDMPQGSKQMTPGGIIFGASAPSEPQDPFAGTSGSFTDSRDSQVYDWVKIGTQIWMADNLNIDSGSISGTRYCYQNSSSNCNIYGGLYNWADATNNEGSSTTNPSGIRGICPEGWHIPSGAEWVQLNNYLSSDSTYWCNGLSTQTGKALASTSGWTSSATVCRVGNSQASNNLTGFTALPAGLRNGSASYTDLNAWSYFWTSSESSGTNAFTYGLGYNNSAIGIGDFNKIYSVSVRCIKD